MKKILVVIDMQNDFIDGALGTPPVLHGYAGGPQSSGAALYPRD